MQDDFKQDEYFSSDNRSSVKENPEDMEFQRLCYEVFITNNSGKMLMEKIFKRFILKALISPVVVDERGRSVPVPAEEYKTFVVYYEGFKEALRGLHKQALEYQLKLNEGAINV
jgi:hypothetical protein